MRAVWTPNPRLAPKKFREPQLRWSEWAGGLSQPFRFARGGPHKGRRKSGPQSLKQEGARW